MCRVCEKSCLTRFVTETSVKLPCPKCLNMKEGDGGGGDAGKKNTLTLHFQERNCLEKKKQPSVWTHDVLVLCLCLALSSKPVMIYSLQVEQRVCHS